MMSMLKKIVLFPISLFVAFLALMARWLLTLSSYVVAPLMLYIFGCGIYTAYRQTWDQFFILLVAEFICFVLFFGATAITEDIDARYDAFANAEASLINNALVVPMGMSVPNYLATRLNYWEGQYASTGFSNKRLKGIHVLDHYISMSEYEANRDAR
jgi:c-di-AMP phosphodiesterase-like protein